MWPLSAGLEQGDASTVSLTDLVEGHDAGGSVMGLIVARKWRVCLALVFCLALALSVVAKPAPASAATLACNSGNSTTFNFSGSPILFALDVSNKLCVARSGGNVNGGMQTISWDSNENAHPPRARFDTFKIHVTLYAGNTALKSRVCNFTAVVNKWATSNLAYAYDHTTLSCIIPVSAEPSFNYSVDGYIEWNKAASSNAGNWQLTGTPAIP
jgi:hypothetical protein